MTECVVMGDKFRLSAKLRDGQKISSAIMSFRLVTLCRLATDTAAGGELELLHFKLRICFTRV